LTEVRRLCQVGQSAKPGLGGHLPEGTVVDEIANHTPIAHVASAEGTG
jgi:glutamate synthase domain-containing protein 2